MAPENAALPPKIKVTLNSRRHSWIGSYGHGIFILDRQSQQLHSLAGSNPWNITIPARFLFDIQMFNQQYWLATEQGVWVLDQQYNIVKHYTTTSPKALNSNIVRSLYQDKENNIWVGTTQGLSILAQDSDAVLSINESNSVLVSLQSEFIFNIFGDSKGAIWLGTYTGGLHRYNAGSTIIKHYRHFPNSQISVSDNMVWAFAEAKNDKIWIATQSGGLNLFTPATGHFDYFLQQQGLSIWDLKVDGQHRLWLATSNGVYVYNYTPDHQLTLSAHMFKGEAIDKLLLSDTQFWLSTSQGLTSVALSNLSVAHYPLFDGEAHSIRPLIQDSLDRLWVSSSQGLALFQYQDGQLNHLKNLLPERKMQAHSVLENNQFFWLSTFNSGLLKMNKHDLEQVEVVPLTLTRNTIPIFTTIHNSEYLWTVTAEDIYKFDMQNNTVVQSLARNLFDFNELNEGAGLVTQSGLVLLGGTKGFHVFEAGSEISTSDTLTPAPTITTLHVRNKTVLPGNGSQLKRPINMTSELILENRDFPFTLSFSLVNPVNKDGVEYRYKMTGLTETWFEVDAKIRRATFSNLSFGQYEFILQAREPGHHWSAPRELFITVRPPMWLKQNALIGYTLLLLLFIYYLYKQYKIRKQVQQQIKDNEERLKLTLWGSGDELWDWDIPNEAIIRVNQWLIADFPQDAQRSPFNLNKSNIHPSDLSRVQVAMHRHLEQQSDYFEVTYRMKTRQGKWIWVLDRGKIVEFNEHKLPIRMTGTLKNISHLKQAEEQLKLFKRSIETISDGVFIADSNFRLISVNPAYCHITGESKEQAIGSYVTFKKYSDSFESELKYTLKQKGNWSGEIESVRLNDNDYFVDMLIDAIYGEDRKISHYVGVFSDITTRKSTEKELLKLANSDTLTELPNRTFFQASHQDLVRKDITHALLCMDMDNFKKINDSLGHETGDRLIKIIATRLQTATSKAATCYRLGGDEFSVLIENTDIHQITHLAQKILDEMKRSFAINNQEFVLSGSMGIACYPQDGLSPQELLRNADTAMYHAKNEGGNQYQFFSHEMNQNAVRQLQIENLIRHGLKEDLFTLYYQPKVDIASGHLVSMEALVRFEHPQKGIVSPGQFIPLAEETGQIIEIGDRILHKACEQTQKWVEQGLFNGRVAVNISARQFELQDLDKRIADVLAHTGLAAKHLECEITESALMQQPQQALELMNRMRNMGIHLALDDFGTGYSSLAYLKQFPLNTLKIDKAFIDGIVSSHTDRQMTAAIISIAHNLGLEVVAEGVEDEDQLAILRRFKCETLQGYLFSRPLSTDKFSQLLTDHSKLNQWVNP